MPLSINCWPSISGGESFVNIEYESFAEFDLQNVVVAIPCHQPPRINQVLIKRSGAFPKKPHTAWDIGMPCFHQYMHV